MSQVRVLIASDTVELNKRYRVTIYGENVVVTETQVQIRLNTCHRDCHPRRATARNWPQHSVTATGDPNWG
jgi:hypothetical protein